MCLHLNNAWALQQAKRNIEKSYSVVGVLEHMDVTLRVLQDKLPHFFEGVLQLYYQNDGMRKNENPIKEDVTLAVKQMLQVNLTNEYELYNFALQRLYKQYSEIKKRDLENILT
jgi:hypothetical protein